MNEPPDIQQLLRETEARLRRTEQERDALYHAFLQAPAIIALLSGPDHVFTFANPPMRQLLGGRDLVGKPVREAMPELEGQGFLELLDGVFQSGQPFIGTEQPATFDSLNDDNSEERFFNFVYQPVRAADGSVEGIMVHAVDVTDQVLARRKAEGLVVELEATNARLQEQQSELAQLNAELRSSNAKVEAEVCRRTEELAQRTEELRKSQAFLAEAQGLAHLGSWDWELGSDRITWSDELFRIFGLNPQASAPSLDVFMNWLHPEDRDILQQSIHQVMQGQPITVEYRVVRPDGTLRYIRAHGERIMDSAGKPSRIVGTAQDITEQKQTELELIEQRNFVEELAKNLPVGIAYADARIVYQWVNSTYARVFGRKPEEFVGKYIFEMFPGTEEQIESLLTNIVRTGEPFSAFSWPFSYTDELGSVHQTYWDLTIVPLYDNRRQVKGLLASATEVTPRVQLERDIALRTEELERERTFIKRMIDNAPAGIAFLDRDLIFRTVNSQYAELVRIPAEQILDRSLSQVFGEQGEEQVGALLRGVIESGEPYRATAFPFTYSLDGVKRTTYWDLTYQPVVGTSNRIEGVLVLAVEVSARVERERVQEAQIRHLREVDTLKDQFISILSHELRTPINAITGFGSILDDEVAGPLTEQQHMYLDKILAGADALLNLVNDLLDMSRIQAGKFQLNPGVLKFSEVVRGALETLNPLAERKQLSLLNVVPNDLPNLVADEQRIRQVLNNLVGNAIKFTPEGGTIRVRARVEGNSLYCEVEDTGTGIAKQDIPKLFKPFTQVDMSSTRAAGGTGLGLSITKALIDAHGGRIGLESEVGRGSTFWFSLPLDPPGTGQ